MNSDKITERIRKARSQTGLSQNEIADIMDIHVNTYSNFEKGKINYVNKYLVDFAKICNCSEEFLLLGFDPDQNATIELREAQQRYSESIRNQELEYHRSVKDKERELEALKEKIRLLEDLVTEKDKRIGLLEHLLEGHFGEIHPLEKGNEKDCLPLQDETENGTETLSY